jgi:hypothetical protein
MSALQVLGDADARHALIRRRIPTREEFQRVLDQVDELMSRLDALNEPSPSAPAPAAESAATVIALTASPASP